MLYQAYISGTGSYLPEKTLTNKDLENLTNTTDEWITERTGIKSRHIVNEHQATSDMAFEASVKALEVANLSSDDIDLILVATTTPDHLLPNTACLLQARLKAKQVMACDLSAACSGFLYTLAVADQFIQTGFHQNILVVGTDVLSKWLHFEDRQTCILFGDGAGAVIVSRSFSDQSKLLSHHLSADGYLSDLLILPAGGSRLPITHNALDQKQHHLQMKGRDVFKHAVRSMSEACTKVLQKANLSIENVDWFIPHQANLRIIEAIAKQMVFPFEKIIVNIQHTGNTSAASIPVAMDEAIHQGRIKRGQVILMAAFGGGLTYGASVMRF